MQILTHAYKFQVHLTTIFSPFSAALMAEPSSRAHMKPVFSIPSDAGKKISARLSKQRLIERLKNMTVKKCLTAEVAPEEYTKFFDRSV